jgi:hypothetical protein
MFQNPIVTDLKEACFIRAANQCIDVEEHTYAIFYVIVLLPVTILYKFRACT